MFSYSTLSLTYWEWGPQRAWSSVSPPRNENGIGRSARFRLRRGGPPAVARVPTATEEVASSPAVGKFAPLSRISPSLINHVGQSRSLMLCIAVVRVACDWWVCSSLGLGIFCSESGIFADLDWLKWKVTLEIWSFDFVMFLFFF